MPVQYLGKKAMYEKLKSLRPDICKMKDCTYKRYHGTEWLKGCSTVMDEEYVQLSSQFGGKWMKLSVFDFDGNVLLKEIFTAAS